MICVSPGVMRYWNFGKRASCTPLMVPQTTLPLMSV